MSRIVLYYYLLTTEHADSIEIFNAGYLDTIRSRVLILYHVVLDVMVCSNSHEEF